MEQLFMNLATLVGGVGGVLIGAVFFAIVIAFLLLPILFMSLKNELRETEDVHDLSRVRKRPVTPTQL